ncbi:MAG: GNAT family N-acetyltransferase [Proteobacteria bacterium]|nr:GNAT family N-acetyltransferase [Pseudomonadota bacterium]
MTPPARTQACQREVRIVDGHEPQCIALVRELFLEYASWLNLDLCFQGFDAEIAALPGAYAPPRGALLLAFVADQPAGCVAMRPLQEGCVEMKRLWVRPLARSYGVGRALAQSLIERAARSGYERMRLDTLAHMTAALALYRELDFREIGAYYDNPLPGAIYLEKILGGD